MFNIPLRVRNLIRKHDTPDPLLIAKEMKIRIMQGVTPNDVNGFWRRILRRKYIGLNNKLKKEWQRKAVVAHEIAHILLHPGYTSYCMAGRTFYSKNRYEDEADEFAAELLSYSSDIEREYILDFLKNGWQTHQKPQR
jgi:Zn-dependent peptidase ImmA (M78 family)